MTNDTLIIIGVEGVIHPIVPRGAASDPTLMSEALDGISFSTGLFTYHRYGTASTGTSIWCAHEVVELMRGILSADSPVDVATCTYPSGRVEDVFEALTLPEPAVHIPAEHDAGRDNETWFMSQKTAPILNYLRDRKYDRLIWVDTELNHAQTQQYQALYDTVREVVLVAPEPETGLHKAEIALLHELCGTKGK